MSSAIVKCNKCGWSGSPWSTKKWLSNMVGKYDAKVVRKCHNCNWESPSHYTGTLCKICATTLNEQFCCKCDKVQPIEMFYVNKTGRLIGKVRRFCRACDKVYKKQWDKAHPKQKYIRHKRVRARHVRESKERYENWVDLMDVDFKVLSEKDWIATCAYFNGCAICGSPHIEVREFFVPFKAGGRYTAWNILPMCEKCALTLRCTTNLFKWLDSNKSKKIEVTKERKQRLLDYFILQAERIKSDATKNTSV